MNLTFEPNRACRFEAAFLLNSLYYIGLVLLSKFYFKKFVNSTLSNLAFNTKYNSGTLYH